MKFLQWRHSKPTATSEKNGSIFEKFLFYLVFGCVLTSVIAVMVYLFAGASVHARRIAEEMLPRAESMSRLATRLQSGQISYDSFLDFSIKEQLGTRVYIFDENANLIAYTTENGKVAPSISQSIFDYGEKVVGSGEEFISTKWRSSEGVVVGVPIKDNMQRVTGAILMSRSSDEVYSSLMSFVHALMLSSLVASVFMVIPAYFISRRMAKPIRTMTRASAAMASGNFSVRADESRDDEIGQLGAALNHLSRQLQSNISNLILARNRLHFILDGLREGVVALEADHSLIYKNQAACRLLGVCAEEDLMQTLATVLPLCDEVRQSGEAKSQTLSIGERKLLLVVSLSQETSELAPGTVIVAQDVTEAERLEQTRKDYVANVSHELRTPIASIRSLAEALNDGLVKKEDDRSRYYGYILRESMRLSRLINDLLELSRLQSGAIALEKADFHLDGVISEVVEQTSLVASYSGIRVTERWNCEKPLLVHSNSDRIEQVLIALVDNAIKFASDDGVIVLDVKKSEDNLRAIVSVMNTGHIPEEHLPHLFERFYKADMAHTDGGTGLGLAIVHEILSHLGEAIETQNEGEYAVFRFTVAISDQA
ncbi:MAG: histidine kinase dimerization/phospho-acceptor domain-containing protein [Eubacteriales bacterium]|nr:histidine kinase dimerization/phospho-acceptor domain-containing protein [Eubacteriales bacterium]